MNQDIINIDQVNDLPTLKKSIASLVIDTQEDAAAFLAVKNAFNSAVKKLTKKAYNVMNESYRVKLRKIRDGEIVLEEDEDPANFIIGNLKLRRIEAVKAAEDPELIHKSANYLYYEQIKAGLLRELEKVELDLKKHELDEENTWTKPVAPMPEFQSYKITPAI